MFRSLKKENSEKVTVSINSTAVEVDANSSVWAALALADDKITRLAPVTEQPRSAYCAMGVCFECLVEIDDVPNRQACLTQVSDGMQIKRQEITQTSLYTPEVTSANNRESDHD